MVVFTGDLVDNNSLIWISLAACITSTFIPTSSSLGVEGTNTS